MSHSTKGSCFCGEVSFELTGNIGLFQYCHCSRCRKVTGSAHASNLFVTPEQICWLSGKDFVASYRPENTKYFATSFCRQCGSSLPWLSKNGKVVIVPAGSLDGDPEIRPKQNIFCASKAEWYVNPSDLPQFDELPTR